MAQGARVGHILAMVAHPAGSDGPLATGWTISAVISGAMTHPLDAAVRTQFDDQRGRVPEPEPMQGIDVTEEPMFGGSVVQQVADPVAQNQDQSHHSLDVTFFRQVVNHIHNIRRAVPRTRSMRSRKAQQGRCLILHLNRLRFCKTK